MSVDGDGDGDVDCFPLREDELTWIRTRAQWAQLAVALARRLASRSISSMVGLELDTAPSQVERYYELLRQMSPAARLRAASAATRRVRLFAEAGLRQRFPEADDTEIRIRLTALLYGREAAMRVHGKIPEDLA